MSAAARRLRVVDLVAAVAFTIGGSLFALGAALAELGSLAAFVNPETSSAVNEAVANWGTFAGALCFAIGGVLQGIGGMHHRERHASAIA
jgi:hypothetical protein